MIAIIPLSHDAPLQTCYARLCSLASAAMILPGDAYLPWASCLSCAGSVPWTLLSEWAPRRNVRYLGYQLKWHNLALRQPPSNESYQACAGDESSRVSHSPDVIDSHHSRLFKDSHGVMPLFMWLPSQKGVASSLLQVLGRINACPK